MCSVKEEGWKRTNDFFFPVKARAVRDLWLVGVVLPTQTGAEQWLTVTREVRRSHVLDGDLLQEGRFLAARVSTHHPGLLQPLTQPGQVTVAHIWVGQKVSGKIREESVEISPRKTGWTSSKTSRGVSGGAGGRWLKSLREEKKGACFLSLAKLLIQEWYGWLKGTWGVDLHGSGSSNNRGGRRDKNRDYRWGIKKQNTQKCS